MPHLGPHPVLIGGEHLPLPRARDGAHLKVPRPGLIETHIYKAVNTFREANLILPIVNRMPAASPSRGIYSSG